VAILSYTLLVLASMLVQSKNHNGPRVPVKMDTMAGYMYYLVESKMLSDFEGLELTRRRDRDRLVAEMGRLYIFGEIQNNADERRVGVDYFDPAGARTK